MSKEDKILKHAIGDFMFVCCEQLCNSWEHEKGRQIERLAFENRKYEGCQIDVFDMMIESFIQFFQSRMEGYLKSTGPIENLPEEIQKTAGREYAEQRILKFFLSFDENDNPIARDSIYKDFKMHFGSPEEYKELKKGMN